MTPSQLRYFLVLCETKNFTRAAHRCAVSQPSLTDAIKALEDELGGALFFRRPQVQLTTLGRALRPHFRSIVKAIDKTPHKSPPRCSLNHSEGAAVRRCRRRSK